MSVIEERTKGRGGSMNSGRSRCETCSVCVIASLLENPRRVDESEWMNEDVSPLSSTDQSVVEGARSKIPEVCCKEEESFET